MLWVFVCCFKQNTAYEMRISDWSSDVCSSDLFRELLAAPAVAQRNGDGALGIVLTDDEAVELGDDLARREEGGLVLVADDFRWLSHGALRCCSAGSRW